MMVVLVIVGVLAAVAYPAYTSHVLRSRRADAVAFLSAIVQAQERYRTNRSEYARTLSALGITASTITRHYAVTLAGVGNPESYAVGYVATARPISTSPQANDSQCATLTVQMDGSTLSYLATDSAANDTSAACWPR